MPKNKGIDRHYLYISIIGIDPNSWDFQRKTNP